MKANSKQSKRVNILEKKIIKKKESNENKKISKKIAKKPNNLNSKNKKIKAQMSVELIIVLGILILIGVVVGALFLSSSNQSIDTAGKLDEDLDTTRNDFSEQINSDASNGNTTEFIVNIISPATGASYGTSQQVNFVESHINGIGNVSCEWKENNNSISNSCVFSKSASFFGHGDHTIKLIVIDSNNNTAQDDVTFNVSGLCGNGYIEGTENCDGSNLGENTCLSLGFKGGTLSCTASCDFNTSGCIKCTNGEINFNDSNLEIAVKKNMLISNDDPVCVEDAENYADPLDLSSSYIIDINGLQYFINIRELNLEDNQITNLLPISNLSNLISLRLQNNRILSVENLSNLIYLNRLYIDIGNNISDYCPIDSFCNEINYKDFSCPTGCGVNNTPLS